MSKYRIEDYLALCALTYFDINNYQKGMRIFDFIQECLMKTDNLSVFFKNMLHYLNKFDLNVFGNLNIVDYMNDNQKSGIVYYCFEDNEDCYVLFRGSELYDPIVYENGWQDWIDNLEIFLGITKQQLIAYDSFKKIHTDKKIHLIGHSKGGNLALFIGVVCNEERFSQIEEIVMFNAPQLNGMDMYEKRIHDKCLIDKIISIENETDMISSIFESIKKPIYVVSNYQGNQGIDFYGSHQIWGFKMENNELIVCDSKRNMKLIKQLNQMIQENQKKWFIQQCFKLSKNKELLKRIQESIERWVIQNEKNQ